MSKIVRGSNFHYCIIRGQQLGPSIRYVENTEVMRGRINVKCVVSLQAIGWPNFIKNLSCTPEIQGHFSIWVHLAP